MDGTSKFVRFLDNEALQRWAATVATILFPLVVLPSRLPDAIEHSTVWNWIVVVLAVGATAVFGADAVTMWRRHTGRKAPPHRPFVAPEDVPAADVETAVASTSNRISAIKMLRERHRGLGLKAAADLVDAVLGADGA